jgi:hypothetical protein
VETVAFYSYKGGVGRSLLLANAARFLATLGKGVVALDFDFEAPGLHYKLGARNGPFPGGAVPYLTATAEGAASPPPLEAHMLTLAVPKDSEGWLRLMPAGPAPHQAYWTAFKEFGERLRFADPSGRGVMALLDLQARIADELKPDYLLIDARTGVTELGGLATTLLADTVVCMFVANQESLDGTLTVVEALKAAPRLRNHGPVRVVPVLARTGAAAPDDAKFVVGTKRLLELGEGKKEDDKAEAKIFALPHDKSGGTERVLAGDQTASSFSPLYEAYLELFQKLFPTGAEPARAVLERLKAVADIREGLTSARREGPGYDELFPPWSESTIEEGVLFKSKQYRGKDTRYADLVCRSESGAPLILAEYMPEGGASEALEFWAKNTEVRCVLLVRWTQHGYADRQIFTRGFGQGEFHEAERWDLPRPLDFELLGDVGDRSVESMLDAVRLGHVEAVAWLVNEWRDASSLGTGPRRHREWDPERARRILDGLAATEHLACAEEILRRAKPGGYDHWHRALRHREDWDFDEGIEQRMAEQLFAPLFWRLPVKAALNSMEERRYPEEAPCLAGYRLVAERLMGLHYDPVEESRERIAQLRQAGVQEGEDDHRRAIWGLFRSRWDPIGGVRLSDDVPPALLWEEALREDQWWRGTMEGAKEKFGDKAKKVLTTNVSLRNRLKVAAGRHELATQGLLGYCESSGRIELYPLVIAAAAEALGLSARYLESVVFIHFSAAALAQEAWDLDGQHGYGFQPWAQNGPIRRESPAHVALAQAFTDRLILLLQDPNLQAAFETLSKHQPEYYSRWRSLRKLPLEKLRVLLLKARASDSALGLPDSADVE